VSKPSIVKELEHLINQGLENCPLPIKENNYVRIGNIAVKKQKHQFSVFDTKNKQRIAKTKFKTSAIAIARQQALGRNKVKEILDLDKDLEKHYSDSCFYKNTLKKSSDSCARFVAETRYQISKAKVKSIIETLDKYIYLRIDK
jgi:hypothetical protein